MGRDYDLKAEIVSYLDQEICESCLKVRVHVDIGFINK
jgi:hypothetical protein